MPIALLSPSGPRRPRFAVLAWLTAALLCCPTIAAQAQNPAAGGLSGVVGVVIDSIHGGVLAGAVVGVVGTTRRGVTDSLGKFKIDSVPVGQYKIMFEHPLLDTIGLALESKPIDFQDGRYAVVALATPSPATLRNVLCGGKDTTKGPAFLVGRVLDADTDVPAVGARVTYVYNEIVLSKQEGIRRRPTVREARVKSNGTYLICSLPLEVRGSLRAETNGAATAEVDVPLPTGSILGLRSLTVGSAESVVVTALPDSAKRPVSAGGLKVDSTGHSLRNGAGQGPLGLESGHAVLSGRVLDTLGRAITGAQVAVSGTAVSGLTGQYGEFTLQALPSGTRELIVRRIGFSPVYQAVELTIREPRVVTIQMEKAVPQLTPVRVETTVEANLQKIGFLDRKKSLGFGRFLGPDDIAKRAPMVMSDLFRTMPGFRVEWDGTEQGYKIMPTRSQQGQTRCINYFIDRAPWTPMDDQDLDKTFGVNEIAAIETYPGSMAPAEFQRQGGCTTVVIWTRAKVGMQAR